MIIDYKSSKIYYNEEEQNIYFGTFLVKIDKRLIKHPFTNNPKFSKFWVNFRINNDTIISISFENITHIEMLTMKNEISDMFNDFKVHSGGSVLDFLNYIKSIERDNKLKELGIK